MLLSQVCVPQQSPPDRGKRSGLLPDPVTGPIRDRSTFRTGRCAELGRISSDRSPEARPARAIRMASLRSSSVGGSFGAIASTVDRSDCARRCRPRAGARCRVGSHAARAVWGTHRAADPSGSRIRTHLGRTLRRNHFNRSSRPSSRLSGHLKVPPRPGRSGHPREWPHGTGPIDRGGAPRRSTRPDAGEPRPVASWSSSYDGLAFCDSLQLGDDCRRYF